MPTFNTNNTSVFYPSVTSGTTMVSPSMLGAISMKRPYVPPLFERTAPGQRLPAINRKLMKIKVTSYVTHDVPGGNVYYFKPQTIDVVIENLGDYNPMYGGKPKALAETLLCCAASSSRTDKSGALELVGLTYAYPYLAGVRRVRYRTSVAGLGLLDYWAEKYPRFKPFVDAYVTTKARREIVSECYDLSIGIRPKSFSDADEKNKVYSIKAQKRRDKKEMARRMVIERAAMIDYQNALANHPYSNLRNNTGTTGINGSQLTGISASNNSVPLSPSRSILSRLFGKV